MRTVPVVCREEQPEDAWRLRAEAAVEGHTGALGTLPSLRASALQE